MTTFTVSGTHPEGGLVAHSTTSAVVALDYEEEMIESGYTEVTIA